MELTHTAGLWTVIAEHGADVEQLYQIGLRIELVLEIGTDSRGGILRTEGNASIAPVSKGVHFLVYYICTLADTTLEQLRMLKNRGTDLAVAKAAAQLPDFLFNIIPIAYCIRQNVLGSTRCICQHSSKSSCI